MSDSILRERQFVRFALDKLDREQRAGKITPAEAVATANHLRAKIGEPPIDAPSGDDPKKAAPVLASDIALAVNLLMTEEGITRPEAIEALAGQTLPPDLVQRARQKAQEAADAEATHAYYQTPEGRRELARTELDRQADRANRVGEGRALLLASGEIGPTQIAALADEDVLRAAGLADDAPEPERLPASNWTDWNPGEPGTAVSGAALGDPEADDLAANIARAERKVATYTLDADESGQE